jgi:hypothetical protein
MAIPKLALIPSGVKAGKLYSVLPTNGDGDFTTTRNTVATRVNENGLIEEVASNVPRLDYSDGGCPSLLLEPFARNYIINSQALSLTPTKNGTFVDNFAISPDGTLNATKLTATDTDPFFYQSVSFATASYTASIYVKGIGSSIGKDFRIVIGSNSTTPKLTIPSEWTRFEYTATMSSGSTNVGLEIADPAVIGDEVLVWGFQLEENSYSTSYIKTIGTTQSRSADTANGAGNASTFNDSSGVLMMEISALANDGTNRYISLSDGSTSNRVNIFFDSNNNLRGFYNGLSGSITINIDTTINNKIAFKYKSGDSGFWVNGIEVATRADSLSLSGLDSISFDLGGGSYFYGNTKQLQYFDSALNDSDLEKLTSWTSFTAMANGQSYTII